MEPSDSCDDVKLVKKMLIGGIALILGVMGYFNTKLMDTVTDMHEGISSSNRYSAAGLLDLSDKVSMINIALIDRASRYEVKYTILESKVDAFSTLCCNEMPNE